MPRPPEFNRDAAIDAAMKLFWVQGYASSSMQQLLDAMGIGKGSFYAAFGSKESLFLECLGRFAERTRDIVVDARKAGQPLAAIRHFFDATVSAAPRHRLVRGCMMVNSVLELAGVEPALAARASAALDDIEAEFAHCFELAQRAGDYPPERDPKELAAMVMLLNQGLRVASRQGGTIHDLDNRLQVALSLLDIAA